MERIQSIQFLFNEVLFKIKEHGHGQVVNKENVGLDELMI